MLRRFTLSALAFAAFLALVGVQPLSAQTNLNVTGRLTVEGAVDLSCGTATGTSNASTLANKCGIITTESATTAAGATFTETITNSTVAATDVCFASATTAGTGTPVVTKVTPGSSSLVIIVQNIHASAAFNNTLAISFLCVKP